MTSAVIHGARAVQVVSLFALVLVFLRPRAAWSLRARLPVAVITFVSSAALLVFDIL